MSTSAVKKKILLAHCTWIWPVVPAFQLFHNKASQPSDVSHAPQAARLGLPHAELEYEYAPPTDLWCGPCGKCGPTIVSDNLPSYHANVTHVISTEQHDSNNSGRIIIIAKH